MAKPLIPGRRTLNSIIRRIQEERGTPTNLRRAQMNRVTSKVRSGLRKKFRLAKLSLSRRMNSDRVKEVVSGVIIPYTLYQNTKHAKGTSVLSVGNKEYVQLYVKGEPKFGPPTLKKHVGERVKISGVWKDGMFVIEPSSLTEPATRAQKAPAKEERKPDFRRAKRKADGTEEVLSGRLMEYTVAKGSKSERNTMVLSMPGNTYVELYLPGGSFGSIPLRSYAGKVAKIPGVWRRGKFVISLQKRKEPERKPPAIARKPQQAPANPSKGILNRTRNSLKESGI